MDTTETKYEHWSLNKEENGVLWLVLDRKDSKVNSLNESVLNEFSRILKYIQSDRSLKGVVLTSGKNTGFIVGADISQFKLLTSAEEATKLIQKGQAIFTQLEDLDLPTVALIDGFCLGGGLELALACKWRIAVDSTKTRLGLPEVKLGIHPGWGGTVRLPNLVGALTAMDVILSGRNLRAKAAKKMGIVDEAPPRRLAKTVAEFYALTPPKRKPLTLHKKLTNSTVLRKPLSIIFKKQLRKKIRPEHYPAPFKVVENWVKYGPENPRAMEIEAHSIGNLLVSDTSRNLVRVFFLQEMLKGYGKKAKTPLRHVHVVGGGTMGGDIAAWCAFKGYHVSLQDRDPKYLGEAFKRAYKLGKKRLKEKHLVQAMMDRLQADIKGDGLRTADVIIEAITENLEIKKKFFQETEKVARKDALLATNTSTIPLEEICQGLSNPSRLVGVHFFNPVAMMPLVEVVKGQQSATQEIDKALAFVKAIDKLPMPVKSAPGFLVNRILLPYMLEAVTLLVEGVPGPLIDKAAKQFGMPMGPIELADTVGLDVCLAAVEKLSESLNIPVPDMLKEYVAKGDLGCKTGKGFYTYKKGKKVPEKLSASDSIPQDLIDRLVLRLLNESVACVREGIVENTELLDAGCIFGFGFPPFRGGPIQYAHFQGEERLLEQLENFQEKFGSRFTADSGWDVVKVA
jgi:3-hydroxyacyl-CoA dehydrogenase/enoyl-CoA hydratase/3-hydroxybutyryl-CoA epimerase